jgi:hypothetical protein
VPISQAECRGGVSCAAVGAAGGAALRVVGDSTLDFFKKKLGGNYDICKELC